MELKLPNIIYNSDSKHLYGLIVRVKDVSECLPPLLKLLREQELNVEYIVGNVNGGEGLIILAVNFMNYLSFSKALENARRIEDIIGIEVVPPIAPGLLVFPNLKPLMYDGNRAIIMSRGHCYSIIEAIKEKFKVQAPSILWHLWYEAGKRKYKAIKERISGNTPISVLEAALKFLGSLGWWTRFQILYLTESPEIAVKIRLWDNWECSEILRVYGKANKPQSHLVRGFISGLLSEFFGTEVLAFEVKCIAEGNEYCEFTGRVNPYI